VHVKIEFVNLGFFSLRFHPLVRPFEFVYSGYSQSRSAYPLSHKKSLLVLLLEAC
jgi:hypothetical protein